MSDFSKNNVRCLSKSRGGVKYDLVLSESPNKKTKKLSSPPKKDVSLMDIEQKLEAAEKRRLSQEHNKQRQCSKRLSHVMEVQKKKNIFIKNFKKIVRENHDRKMKLCRKNREAYLSLIQQKNRDLVMRVREIRNTMNFLKESQFNIFCKRFEDAEQIREEQFRVLENHLMNQDRKMDQLKLQIELLRSAIENSSINQPIRVRVAENGRI